jgi:hypothetical protein
MEVHDDKPSFVGKDYSPFKGEFVKTLSGGISGDMDLVKSKENGALMVIRTLMLSVGEHRPMDVLRMGAEKMRELQEFGINIPNFDVVLGAATLEKNPKRAIARKNNAYMIVDFVDGVPLIEAPSEARQEVSSALAKYYEHCRLTNTPRIADLSGESQYIYGSINGGAAKPYLVDIDLTNVPGVMYPELKK